MFKLHFNNEVLFSLIIVSVILVFFSFSVIVSPNQAIAAGKFTIAAKINLKKLDTPDKLMVVASADGDSQVKNVTGNDLKSGTATVSFQFDQKNDLVTVGSRDEYFVCAYDLNAITDGMKSYACVEGNIEQPNGKNTINLGPGPAITLSTGPFQPVNGKEVKDVTLESGYHFLIEKKT